MNILIYFCILLLSLLTIYIANKNKDKIGLIVSFVIMNLLSFILAFKYITISNLTINANSITYITLLSILYLYLEKTNKKETKKLININTTINIFIVSLLALMSLYIQSLDDTIGNLSIVIEEAPSIILMSKVLIPKKINDTHSIYEKMTKEGYNLDYLKIDYNIEESEKKIADVLDIPYQQH